jgi:signal transduction histidine kinase/ligand-binding sensor domain-containing protein/DNA-binding response OmpR family regulator
MRLKFAILLLTFCVQINLSAQQSSYNFSQIDIFNGLSNNQVNAIFKDDKGFMWFGTMAGLNRWDGYKFRIFKHEMRDSTSINDDFITKIEQGPENKIWVDTRRGWNIFDPNTEKFDVRPEKLLASAGLPDGSFTDIVKDNNHNFWFAYPGKGLYKYNEISKKTEFYSSESPARPIYSNDVSSVAIAPDGDVWIIYKNRVLDKIDKNSGSVTFRSTALRQLNNQAGDFFLFADNENDLWIYGITGAFYYKPSSNTVLPLNKDSKKLRLNTNVITGMIEDDKGNIWIATDHGGVNLVNRNRTRVDYLMNDENDAKSLNQNSINSIYKDDLGIIWVGTFKKGINYFHNSTINFPLLKHNPFNKNSLPYDDINRFAEDEKGNLWIGTNGGGLIYFDRKNNSFKRYQHDASNPNSLSNDVIVSLCIDHEKKLWIGTYYGGLNCFDGKKFIHYRNNKEDANSLSDDRVWEIMEDRQNRLWIGTLAEGLDLFDRQNNKFIHYKANAPNSIHSTYIADLLEDRNGNIWIATAYGIDVLEKKTGAFKHYLHVDNDPSTLSQNNVIDIFEDSRGLIWVGTRDGLNLFDSATHTFKTYRTNDGLPDNCILTILEDNNHNLWLSTPNGLANGVIRNNMAGLAIHFINYDETDGLQGKQFNENAALKTRSGELTFGGANGFNIFYPKNITSEKTRHIIVLTDMQIFNKSVKIGEKYNGHIILPQSVTRDKEITLPYNQNVFTFEFADLEYYTSQKIKYAYQLEGFNNNWLITDAKNRNATFTNLDPGEYVFKVKVINDDGSWSKEVLLTKIRILPPFWRTPLAYFSYLFLLIVILFIGRQMIIKRARLRFEIEQERKEASRQHEFDMMKIKFFTNVSHEFRTPLSLIISPTEKLINNTPESDIRDQFLLIHRNARRLLNLVNQLLDFRKMEEKELQINMTDGNIIQFVKEISFSFSELANSRKIAFNFHSSTEKLFASFDHDKLERILFNLLSNAFKFTDAGGKVKVEVSFSEKKEKPVLQITVSDTGIGIEKEKHEKIFERFFQNDIPQRMVNQGSGIGLAITKEFVKMLEGTIVVNSELGKGSSFLLSLPLSLIEQKSIVTEDEKEPICEQLCSGENETNRTKHDHKLFKKKIILIVEDNEDFRQHLKDNLKHLFIVEEAENGKSGWNKTLSIHPDLVLCDISMPEMNGIDLCKKIRSDKRTYFIPVIMLTALTAQQQLLAGLNVGANDYLTKPFNTEVLLSKVKNILFQQESFKKTYQKQVQVHAKEVEVESADEKYIQQALSVVEENISNPGFSVEEMSRQLFMSRVAMYKKLFALTGKTPIEFIRTIRLQRAAQLLESSEMTIAEIAYEVGFNNPKHFSKCFKNEFNILPSGYVNEKKASVKM